MDLIVSLKPKFDDLLVPRRIANGPPTLTSPAPAGTPPPGCVWAWGSRVLNTHFSYLIHIK